MKGAGDDAYIILPQRMFTDKIKEVTLSNHQQVEKTLVGQMKNIRSTTDYVELLRLFYGYFGGLELKIRSYIDQSNLPDYNQRRKTDAITDDIKALGGTLSETASDNELPAITNTLQAFGALYVIEGSTLGGKIISGIMQKHLHFNNNEGLSFFNGYGDQTQQMWDSFKQTLNEVVTDATNEDEVLSAANQTFDLFGQWLSK
jgi:heme oxygenase